MSDLESDFVFNGLIGLTSGQFVRTVRQNALNKDKGTDDLWIGLYASAHMDGLALQWLEEQTEETQESWRLLRRALLIRWPPATPLDTPQVPVAAKAPFEPLQATPLTISTPPAAPPVSALTTPLLPTVQAATTPDARKGVIKMVSVDGKQLGYLSKSLDADGDHITTSSISDAQIVHFIPSYTPCKIYLGRSPSSGPCLGFSESDDKSNEDPRFGVIATLKERPTKGLSTSSKDYPGESHPILWWILLDGSMVPFWEEASGARSDLELAVAGKNLTATVDYKRLKERYPDWGSERSRFVFESTG